MTSALEDIKTLDLEEWLTLATAPSSTKLKQGQSPNMNNVWVDEKPGSVITAPGFVKAGTLPSNNPIVFCINYFNTSSGVQLFVASDGAIVYTTVDFVSYTTIISGLNSSFQLRGIVIRDKLWLTNGSDTVRIYDGTSVATPAFVPKGRYIAYHDERVWIYHTSSARSAVYFSSVTDSAGAIIEPDVSGAWDTTDNFLQISQGDADFGTGMIIYRGYLFFFKQYSAWRLVGYDEYTYSRVKTRSSTGTRFNESIQILDNLVHLIGVDGIYVFDGEESERISDIIDPATASQTAFGFNQLQQPNTNNQFWEVSSTSEFNSGTVAADLAVDNSLTLQAADDSQTNFQSGVTQTNVDLTTDPGTLELSHTNSGSSTLNIALDQLPVLDSQTAGNAQIGALSFLTDGNVTNSAGFSGPGNAVIHVPFSHSLPVTKIVFKGLIPGSSSGSIVLTASLNGNFVAMTLVSISGGGATLDIPNTTINFPSSTSAADITLTCTAFTADKIQLRITSSSGLVMTEFQVFATAYNTTGKFTSRTLDLGLTPAAFGTFNATETLNSQTASYFTQSSADGSSWDSEVSVSNGGSIGSTVRRYLRWGVNLTSDGTATPTIDAAYLPAVYLSAIHNTGGSIFAWGPFDADYSMLGQTINFYYRTATTSGGVSAASWNLIVPGSVVSSDVTQQYIQFKIEISGGLSTNLPVVRSVTVNWVVGVVAQPSTLQNVASAYWRNRYWLSAAGPSATSNDTILIRGKKTFQSPWMLKDWPILSFTRFYDSLYGGSSTDGSIYRLDTGYSKAGSAMDSYFETGDFVFGGFTANFLELNIEIERMGSWTLAIGWSVDNGNTWQESTADLTLKTFDNNYIKRINMNVTATRIRFRFRTNDVDTPFQVHRCIVRYKLEVERGSIRGDYIAA